MALYIPHSILHLARLLYVRPGTFEPYYVSLLYTFRIITVCRANNVRVRAKFLGGKYYSKT